MYVFYLFYLFYLLYLIYLFYVSILGILSILSTLPILPALNGEREWGRTLKETDSGDGRERGEMNLGVGYTIYTAYSIYPIWTQRRIRKGPNAESRRTRREGGPLAYISDHPYLPYVRYLPYLAYLPYLSCLSNFARIYNAIRHVRRAFRGAGRSYLDFRANRHTLDFRIRTIGRNPPRK